MKSLKWKAFVIFSSVFLTALCVTFLFVFDTVSKDLKRQTIDNAEAEINTAVSNVSRQLETMHKTFYSAAFNKRIINELQKPEGEADYQYILRILEEQMYFSNNIFSIYLEDTKTGHCLSTETMSVIGAGSGWFKKYPLVDNKSLELTFTYDLTSSYRKMFSYIGEMKVDFFGETVALLSVNMLQHDMQQFLTEDKVYHSIQFIQDSNGMLLAQSKNFDPVILESITGEIPGSVFISIGNQDYLYLKGVSKEGITYSKLVPKNDIFGSIYKVAMIFIASFIFFAIVILCVTHKLLSYLTEPIYELSGKIRSYRQKENEQVEFKTDRKDEFAYLFKSLEDMTNHIDYLIDESYKSDLYKKEMQLKLYRASINPHFIFNLLDSIMWTLKFKDYPKVENTLSYFADFFRSSLTQMQDYVTVGDMKIWLNSYCYLTNFLKDNQIVVQMEIEDSLDNVLMPSLLIQPIIENAFKYAFVERTSGEILVRMEKKDAVMSVLIKDNGIGMSDEALGQLYHKIQNYNIHETTRHFGLASVYQRLSLLSGGKPVFRLTSAEEFGTEIYFEIGV